MNETPRNSPSHSPERCVRARTSRPSSRGASLLLAFLWSVSLTPTAVDADDLSATPDAARGQIVEENSGNPVAGDPQQGSAAPNRERPFADKPLARLGDQSITLDDIDPKIADEVYRQKLETYTLLVRAVNEVIERRLLEEEAQRRDISVEELERLLAKEGKQTRVELVNALREGANFKMLLTPPRQPRAESGREPASRAVPPEDLSDRNP